MGVVKQPDDIIIGKKYSTKSFGDFIITAYRNAKEVDVRFIETGYETTTRAWLVRNGMVKDRLLPTVCGVGFIGDGIYEPYINTRKSTQAYSVWSSMIDRCYNPKSKAVSYRDCEVCEEWQDFQCFAEWFYDNYPQDGLKYDLDKDIKVKGNRIYGLETCLFVTREENMDDMLSRIRTPLEVVSPEGDVHFFFSQAEFCREFDLSKSSICKLVNGKIKQFKGWTLAK